MNSSRHVTPDACGMQGPPVDVEARRPFIDRLLAARSRPPAPGSAAAMGPPKHVTAHTALLHLLHSNRDLLGSAVDQCYAAEVAVARGYFKVRACVSKWKCQTIGQGPD